MNTFSIIIPTWKNLAYLDLACRSLARHSAAAHEVIVFFNEEDEEARAWAARNPAVRTMGAGRNLGVCEAVNRAAATAARDYLCFFNDDMYALPGWDEALDAYIGLAPSLWLSGTAVEAGRATPCYIGGQDYGTSPETFDEERLLRDAPRLRRPYNTVSTWTPWLLSKADWQAVGGFDEAYFPGNGSDPDLAMKMYRHGCRYFIGVGTSLVYHFSRRTIARFDGRPPMDPKELFERKWGMTWKRFLNRRIFRDSPITPDLLDRIARRAGG